MYKPEGQLTNYKEGQSFSELKIHVHYAEYLDNHTFSEMIACCLNQIKGILPVAFSFRL